MKEVVALCLQKDPADRPSADKLLQHKFFKVRRSGAASSLGGAAGGGGSCLGMRGTAACCLQRTAVLQHTPASLLKVEVPWCSALTCPTPCRPASPSPPLSPLAALPPPHHPPGAPQQAQGKDYLRKHLMADLPPLSERVREIRTGGGKAATNAADNDRQLAASQVGACAGGCV